MFRVFLPALVCFVWAATPAHADPTVVASGSFEGRNDHVVTGGMAVVKTDAGFLVVLDRDFSLDDAPDPRLGFGNGGSYAATSQFSKLDTKEGAQVYVLPANVTPTDFDEFYLWCERFSVPLGVASLK